MARALGFLGCRRGAAAVEYGLIVALLSAVLILAGKGVAIGLRATFVEIVLGTGYQGVTVTVGARREETCRYQSVRNAVIRDCEYR